MYAETRWGMNENEIMNETNRNERQRKNAQIKTNKLNCAIIILVVAIIKCALKDGIQFSVAVFLFLFYFVYFYFCFFLFISLYWTKRWHTITTTICFSFSISILTYMAYGIVLLWLHRSKGCISTASIRCVNRKHKWNPEKPMQKIKVPKHYSFTGNFVGVVADFFFICDKLPADAFMYSIFFLVDMYRYSELREWLHTFTVNKKTHIHVTNTRRKKKREKIKWNHQTVALHIRWMFTCPLAHTTVNGMSWCRSSKWTEKRCEKKHLL